MKSPNETPKLIELADACNNGACNVGALLRSLAEAANELPFGQHREHPAIKVILGQLSYLCGESLGPTLEALQAYEQWCNTCRPASARDFAIENHGSLVLVRPLTEAGKEFLARTAPEDVQFFGEAMVVEPRYIEGVCKAIQAEGLNYE